MQLSASVILPKPGVDIGSRFGVDSYNSRAFLLYQEAILRTLRNASQLNKLASELMEIMRSDQVGLINLECSILSLIYFTIISPFHSVVSKNNLPFIEAITIIKTTKERIRQIEQPDSDPYNLLLQYVKSNVVSAKTDLLIPIAINNWESLNESPLFDAGKRLARQMCKEMQWKVSKDCDDLLKLPFLPDDIIPLTNRLRVAKGL